MKITIPKPCYENWDLMTPTEKGRFCAVCSKVVRDFTECNYDEIYEELSTNEKICGRFRGNQLNQNLRFLALKSFAIGLLIAGNSFSAQNLSGNDVKKIDFKKGINGISEINNAVHKDYFLGMPSAEMIENSQPVIVLDNKKISEEKMMKLKSETIESVNILIGDEAKKYGKRGIEYGAIIITSKQK